MSKYGVISDPYYPVFSPNTKNYGLEITSYLDTFHSVISTFSTKETLKLDSEAQFLLIAMIFGWALYFAIALMTGSQIFSDVQSI